MIAYIPVRDIILKNGYNLLGNINKEEMKPGIFRMTELKKKNSLYVIIILRTLKQQCLIGNKIFIQ